MHLLIALQTRAPCDCCCLLCIRGTRVKVRQASRTQLAYISLTSRSAHCRPHKSVSVHWPCLGTVQSSFERLLLSAESQLQLHHQPCINLYSLLKHMQTAVAPMGHKTTHEQFPWSASL